MARFPSKQKAGKILDDGTVRGTPLTKPQRGLMGIIASGGTPNPRRMKSSPKTAPAAKNPGKPGPGPGNPALGMPPRPRPALPGGAGLAIGQRSPAAILAGLGPTGQPRPRPPQLAIGQRPTLGARTRAAIRKR